MRILFAIAHYWRPPSLPRRMAAQLRHIPFDRMRRLGRSMIPGHGSSNSNASGRATALAACVGNLHTLFGSPQSTFDRTKRTMTVANVRLTGTVDVIICTCGRNHVLDRCDIPGSLYMQRHSDCDPRYLPFECQDVLKENLGTYDFYCFLEDDILLHDAWFFEKLRWFASRFGERSLLQPNRFECSWDGPMRKLYIDDLIPEEITKPFQNIREHEELTAPYLDRQVIFRRHSNPHSGCYFLNSAQMEYWTRQPHFGLRDARFAGPLESGATLGIMQTFNIYKPSTEDASFIEVQHFGDTYLRRQTARMREEGTL